MTGGAGFLGSHLVSRLIDGGHQVKIKMKFDPSKPRGALDRMPDLTRAREVMGWSPRTTFGEGLGKTFDWALSRLTR